MTRSEFPVSDRKPLTRLELKLVEQYPSLPLDLIWKFRKVEQANRHRARRKGQKAIKVDYIGILIAQDWKCSICGEVMDRRLPLDHPDGVSLEHNPALCQGGHHIPDHVSGAHRRCNMAKNNAVDTPKAAKIRRLKGKTGQIARRQRRGHSLIQSGNNWPPKGSRKLPTRADKARVMKGK